MKKRLLVLAIAVAAFGMAPAADAQICVAFDSFCDGLEIDVAAGVITGAWVNSDCAGASSTIAGLLSDGVARISCEAGCPIADWEFRFVFRGGSFLFDLWGIDPGGLVTKFVANEGFTLSLGACPFGPNFGDSTARQNRADRPPSAIQ